MLGIKALQLLHVDGDVTWMSRGKDTCIHLSQDAFIRRLARPHTNNYTLKCVCQEALDDEEMAAFEIIAGSRKNLIGDNQDTLDAFDFLWSRA